MGKEGGGGERGRERGGERGGEREERDRTQLCIILI